ncbi:type II 3-dehydroquinate dehydratase [Haloimpatiens sp. FM7315]|uniref:type II 3-dehydroquinate dehydratase n=1 Tax=Haloimpatiens sp. FM7315 TaxID=3298609 RepID=UPI0035A362CF
MKFLIINGPNINMLGVREKDIYGEMNYSQLCSYINESAKQLKIDIDIVQSNIEGEIINFIQKAYFEKYDGIVINPGAYTHYSIAIYDAIKAVSIPTVEVHISNIQNRDEFRKKSVIAPSCIGQICGFGYFGYTMAMMGIVEYSMDLMDK